MYPLRSPFRVVLLILGAALTAGLLVWHFNFRSAPAADLSVRAGEPYAEIELKLKPLAVPKRAAQRGEWLSAHPESGQTFNLYVHANPVRRTAERHTLYLCLVGEFTPTQEKVLETTREYLSLFFAAPVKVLKRVPLKDIPATARRHHPDDGHLQLLAHHFLYERLKADCPADALAYVAFTSADLWTKDADGRDWNFVFGQADLYNRLGVWSLARFGDPDASPDAYRRCLKLTAGTATHETGHILGLHHCVYHECNMNGSNHLEEATRTPTTLCPMCLRKLCWNLHVEPVEYVQKLRTFCEKQGMKEDAEHYRRAAEFLEKSDKSGE